VMHLQQLQLVKSQANVPRKPRSTSRVNKLG